MGLTTWLGRVLSFTRTFRGGVPVGNAKVDVGAGNNLTAAHMAPAGDDSQPLPDDYAAIVRGVGSAQHMTVGYVDPVNSPVAGPGEKRIYARDASGAPVCAVWLKADGSAVVSNAAGSIELGASGTVIINGVTIDPAGNITTPAAVAAASVVANGLELAGHLHLAGTPPGTTGPNQ